MPKGRQQVCYNAEELARFAEWRQHRARQKPDQCDDGELCWVRLGPPACHPSKARCLGCGGWIKDSFKRDQ